MSEKAFDAAVHHRIGLGRYSSWLVRRILAQLNHNERAIVAKVAEMGPDGASAGRLELLIEALRLLQAEGWLVIKRRVTEDLAQLAGAEAEFAAKLVRFTGARGTFSPAPAVAQVWAAVVARPFQGRFLQGWLDGAEEAAARRVRETVRQGFIDGQPTAEIVRALRGTKARQYRDGVLEGSRRGVEAMVRTAVTHTSNVAHQEVYRANADIIEGVEWVSVLDSRTTLWCASRDGKVYPIDSGPRPPAHVNCLVADSRVSTSARITGAFKRWYDGDVVVVRTAGGKQLTCTPNHPILTDGGWVPAGRLKVGAHVVCDAGIKRVALVDGQHEYVEARVEDVAEAIFTHEQMATMPVPTAAEDFHGDGIDNNIAIVATDRSLGDGGKAAFPEHCGQSDFSRGDVGLSLVPRLSGLGLLCGGLSSPAGGVMGRRGELLSLFGGQAGHSCGLLFAPPPEFVPERSQDATDGIGGAAQSDRNAPHADTGAVEAVDLRGVESHARLVGGGAHFDAGGDHLAVQGGAADAKLASNILDGASGPIGLDCVVHVERRKFAGHVFNLETAVGWYVAENIITHNCRSTTIPKVGDIPGVEPFKRPTYAEWLAKQPASVQDDILGPTRGRLYRSGGLKVESFVDRKGSTLSLEELQRRDAAAFQRAGVSA